MGCLYSLDPDLDLKAGDIRRDLIKHAQDLYAVTKAIEQQETKTESEFERQVLRQLVHRGYRVTPQWPVGAFRIDMVVESNGKRLGWRFVCIRGSRVRRLRSSDVLQESGVKWGIDDVKKARTLKPFRQSPIKQPITL